MSKRRVAACTPEDPCHRCGGVSGRANSGKCRHCVRERGRRRYAGKDSTTGWVRRRALPAKLVHVDGALSKACNVCKVIKQLSEFHRVFVRGSVGGVIAMCKSCISYNNSVTRFDAFLINTCKRIDRRKEHTSDLTVEWVKAQMAVYGGKCSSCGITLVLSNKKKDSNQPSIDRVDSTKFHDQDNCRIVCWACNQMKMDMSEDEFRVRILMIAKHVRAAKPRAKMVTSLPLFDLDTSVGL